MESRLCIKLKSHEGEVFSNTYLHMVVEKCAKCLFDEIQFIFTTVSESTVECRNNY